MLAALLIIVPAHAQTPLAIPAPPPPAVLRPVEPGLGVSAEAMQKYEAQRLRIYPAERVGLGTTFGPAPQAHTLDFAEGVNVSAVDLAPRLVVAQGDRLLAVPSVMDLLGDDPTALHERIERKHVTANAWTAVSALGLVGLAVAYRTPLDDHRAWLAGSASMLVGGIVLGGHAQRRANRLVRDVELQYDDRRALVDRVKAHNDALARELGIDPDVSRR